MRKSRWTFTTIAKQARRLADSWAVEDGDVVRCEAGFCPLGIVFQGRIGGLKKLPSPELPPGLTARERLAAWRIAYASDSPVSPDRDRLLHLLGLPTDA
jgi:hypothetical protein